MPLRLFWLRHWLETWIHSPSGFMWPERSFYMNQGPQHGEALIFFLSNQLGALQRDSLDWAANYKIGSPFRLAQRS